MKLVLERKGQPDETPTWEADGGTILLTPPIDEDYWLFRVRLSPNQAVVGFPKFGTIGIGFAREEDWNTNLPYTQPAEDIYGHIAHNKGDATIRKDRCIRAIRLIQQAAIDHFAEARP